MGFKHGVAKRSTRRPVRLVQGLLLCLILGAPLAALARTAIVIEPGNNAATALRSALQDAASRQEEVSVVLSTATTRRLSDWQIPDESLISSLTSQLNSADESRNPAAGVERAFGALAESQVNPSDAPSLLILSDGRFNSGDSESDQRFAQWLTLILAEDIRAGDTAVTWQPLSQDADTALINDFLQAVGASALSDEAPKQIAQVAGNTDSVPTQSTAPASTSVTQTEAESTPSEHTVASEEAAPTVEPSRPTVIVADTATVPSEAPAAVEESAAQVSPPEAEDASEANEALPDAGFSIATLPWWIWLVVAGAVTLIAGLLLSRGKPAKPAPAKATAAATPAATPTPPPPTPQNTAATPPPSAPNPPAPEPTPKPVPSTPVAEEPGPDDTQEFFPTGAQSAVNVAASSTPLFEEKSIEEKFFGETAGTAPEAPPEPAEEIAAPAAKAEAEPEPAPAEPDATPEMDATVIADTSALRALAATPPAAAEPPPPPRAPAAEPESKVESNAATAEAAKKPAPDDDATVLADTRALQALQDAADDDATVLAMPPPRHNK